jgi:hypothetical protein
LDIIGSFHDVDRIWLLDQRTMMQNKPKQKMTARPASDRKVLVFFVTTDWRANTTVSA